MNREVNQCFQYPAGPVVNPEAEIYYIAGPITGDLLGNMPPFYEAEAELLAMGHSTFNPARLDGGDNPREAIEFAMESKGNRSWDWYMRRCLIGLARCTALVALPGWDDSKGASLEVGTALTLGFPVQEWGVEDMRMPPELHLV